MTDSQTTETTEKEKPRGFAAALAAFNSPGKRGPSGNGANAALNVVHAILRASPRPLNGIEITMHALGTGLWKSDAEQPKAAIMRPVTDDVKSETGIIERAGKKGLYRVRTGAPDPAAIERQDVPKNDAIAYATALKSGNLPPLNMAKIKFAG